MRRLPQHQLENLPAGFTLVEILAAIVIIVLGCLGALSLQASAITGGAQANDLAVTSFLAESQSEWLRNKDFNSLEFIDDAPVKLTGAGEVCVEGVTPEAECRYTMTTTVIPQYPTSRSAEVSIKLQWQGQGGTHELVYDTVISDHGF
ncbi:MAG: prepilin-type N-terminal cleavage/methylation domain-containing protein [Candidatus Adiutrix sp.]|jgi:prepilin-type N-terminal cleavage/methylation domain-containing protein|nr:prepilin-type N-terminal cleavage/methylation domain-containing protein [Candidatus Adiutrix sp.]